MSAFSELRLPRRVGCAIASCLAGLAALHVVPTRGRAESLPAGFFPGRAVLDLQVGGTPLEIGLPVSWAGREQFEAEPSSGVRVRLRARGEPGGSRAGSVSVLDLREQGAVGAVGARIELEPVGLGGAVAARFSPRRGPPVVCLASGTGGLDAARGIYATASDRGIDFSATWGGLVLSFGGRSGSERLGRTEVSILLEGRIPRGREVTVLGWQVRDGVLGHRLTARIGSSLVDRAGVGVPTKLTGLWFAGTLSSTKIVESVTAARAEYLPSGSYVEVGEGWQLAPGGIFRFPGRDWSRSDPERHPEGVVALARKLRALNVVPGLWIAPHGHGSEKLFRRAPAAFVRDRKGRPLGGGILGPLVVDPSSPEGEEHLRELASNLTGDEAFGVLRLGGLSRAMDFYREHIDRLADPRRDPVDVLRHSLEVLRRAVDANVLLAGDADSPPEVFGLLDSVRSARSVDRGPDALVVEALAAVRDLPLHGRIDLREGGPITEWRRSGSPRDRAASSSSGVALAVLSGRGLLLDGGRSLLPEEKAWLRDLQPEVRVRPLDLFAHSRPPVTWVLDVGYGSAARPYAIVGLFNWDLHGAKRAELSSRLPGVPPRGRRGWITYDLRAERIVSRVDLPLDALLLPGRSRLLAVHPASGHPQIVGVEGGGPAQLARLRGVEWSEERCQLGGFVRWAPGETLRVHTYVPGPYRIREALVDGGATRVATSGTETVVRLDLPRGGSVDGEVRTTDTVRRARFVLRCDRGGDAERPVLSPVVLDVRYDPFLRAPLLSWMPPPNGVAPTGPFAVFRDGERVGATTDWSFLDTGATGRSDLAYRVAPVVTGSKGGGGEVAATEVAAASESVAFRLPEPEDAWLSEWAPLAVRSDSPAARDQSVTGGPLVVRGRRYQRGFGILGPSRIDFALRGSYALFRAEVGIDDATRFQGSVVFVVLADERELYRSPVVLGTARQPLVIDADVTGASLLSLVTEDGGDGDAMDLGVWGNPRVSRGW